MRKENRVGNDRKNETSKHQTRTSRRARAAEASPDAREFIRASVESAAASDDLATALRSLEVLHSVAGHAPGLQKEAALLRGAASLAELLETIRHPGYSAENSPGPTEQPTEYVRVAYKCAPEDIRDVINEQLNLGFRGVPDGVALLGALESLKTGTNDLPWNEMLLDAKSFEIRLPLRSWRAEIVIVLPSHPWLARVTALQLENQWVSVARIHCRE